MIAWLSYAKVENRFRLNNYKLPTRKNSQTIFYLFLSSLFLSISIYTLGVTEFFGLIKNVNYPQYAGSANQNCENGILVNKPLCKYELAGAKKTILLYGDSFAGSISSALITATRNQNLNLVTSYTNGCALYIDTSNAKKDQKVCAAANANTLNYIKVNKPNLIIVSYYMDQNLDQKRFQNLLLKLKSFVPNVLLIENVPIFPDNLTFMQSKTIFSRQSVYKKYLTENSMNTETRIISGLLREWAINNNIESMDFSSLFCQNDVCTRFENSNWLYSDNKHLSIYGAAKTIPMIEKYLYKLK